MPRATKSNTMPASATKNSNTKPDGGKRKVVPIKATILYPYIEVNGVSIPDTNVKITVAQAKALMGWETEADYFNRLKEEDAKISREACTFGDDYLLNDEEKNKVRCWNNAGNRPFYEHWARSLGQDILNRQWQFNGETVIISKTGRVLSAQHRLVGLILASQIWQGKNQDFWSKKWSEEPFITALVVTGVSEDQQVVNTLDNVKPRSLSDILFTSSLFSDLTRSERKHASDSLQSAVNALLDRTKPTRPDSDTKYQTHSMELEFLDSHNRLVEYVRYAIKCNEERVLSKLQLRPGFCAALLYLMASSGSDPDEYLTSKPLSEKPLTWDNEQKAKKFWEEIAKDTALFKPLRMALAALVDPDSGEDSHPREKACLLAKAWALFLDDMPLSIEDILPEYQRDEEGIRYIVEDQATFGGIDFGDSRWPKDRGEKIDKQTLEERKTDEREASRKRMEERIRKRRENMKRKASNSVSSNEEEE